MKTRILEVTKDESINVTEDTQFVLTVSDFSVENKYTVELVFDTQGVSAQIIFLYALPAKGNLNVTTVANHKATNTSCLTKVRGVLMDQSISNYVGKIVINKDAQQTSSFLEDHVLVVGKGTKNNSQPILTIEADDVKASHGATTGRVDEGQTYYLMSRGLDRGEAHKLIVDGFFAELIEQIDDEGIRAKVVENLVEVKTQ